jgi:hypothetical protein
MQIIALNTLTSDVRDAFLMEEFFELLISPNRWCRMRFLFLFLSITSKRKPFSYLFVADDAFPSSVNFMKPYPGILEQSSQKIFNYRLSRARRTVENTFGLLASVYRIFRRPLLMNLDHSEVVTVIALYLHNFLGMSASSKSICAPPSTSDLKDTENGVIFPGKWRKTTAGDTEIVNLARILRRPANDVKSVREEFKQFFVSNDGRV